ncbi:hypothetical protein DESPIGER_0965 [Desulfovibrio piger]|uniref:Uncharacterized protein n=1 Tax=Desulfovibrio piger TaxID=901 RepID=A0A1K1LDL8_9BACT|nr:hypothetical protein DESPIGER_0965 [Desulfovibrio piger]
MLSGLAAPPRGAHAGRTAGFRRRDQLRQGRCAHERHIPAHADVFSGGPALCP